MSKLRVFEDEDEYLKFCEDNEDRIILVYQDDVLDVTDFLDEHPGGGEILEDYNSQDITEVFHSTHRHVHSHRALKLMSKYKIGYFKDTEAEEHASVIVPDQKQQWTYPIVSQDKIEYREFKIDLRTGLASQVSKLGKRHYIHMLKSPVEIPFTYKVHNNDLLNQVSSSKGLIAGLFWGIFLLYKTISGDPQGSKISQEDSSGMWSFIFSTVFAMVFGVLIGSLLEYFLHRCFYFVEESLPENPTLLWLHFAIFGKHQISPSDTTKVNTPLWFQMVILFVVYSIFSWGFSWRFGILACFGVVFHSMISEHVHYKIHSKGELNENLKRIQQYHNNCHNRKGKSGYGLIFKFWNKIFGTELAQ